MRKFAAFAVFALPLLLVLVLGAAGCGKTSTPSNTVSMTETNFAQQSITISAGQAVNFTNPSGSVHILTLGHNQTPNTSITGGPPELSGGKMITVDAGKSTSVTFPNKGPYEVTCTVHQQMNVTVTVQ